MKRTSLKNRILKTLAVVALSGSIMLPSALAARSGFPDMRATGTFDYSISQGTGKREWHGANNNKVWELEEKETKWWVSILSVGERSIKADLRIVAFLNPDNSILHNDLVGGDGAFAESAAFVPDVGKQYYAVISTSDDRGVYGKTTTNYR